MDAYGELPPDVQDKTSPSTLLQMFLLYRYYVATLDRKSFCRLGSEGRHYLRLSVATDIESLAEGVKRIAAASSDRAGFRTFVDQGENLY
jgi:aspartate/methionine/tyrosine aminotransferase